MTSKMVILRPCQGGRDLKPDEVTRRVEAACASSACAYVETSAKGARERALEWMTQPGFNVSPAQRAALAEAAFFVHFCDDLTREDALLSMLLIPGQPLLIEYSPQAPSDGMPALIARCAKVLGYEVVEQPAAEDSVAPHPQHAAPRTASMWGACAKFAAKFATWMRPRT